MLSKLSKGHRVIKKDAKIVLNHMITLTEELFSGWVVVLRKANPAKQFEYLYISG